MQYHDIIYDHRISEKKSFYFHLHDGCEIYYLVSGCVEYFVEKQIYSVGKYDIFITNHIEIHKPNILDDSNYERISIRFNPEYIKKYSKNGYDLLNCFYNRPNGMGNKITVTEEQLSQVVELFKQIDKVQHEKPPYYEIMLDNCIIRLLIILNEASGNLNVKKSDYALSGMLNDVLAYIDDNLGGDLSLAAFEKKFFVSGAHLCRMFKKMTNSTIHQYIINKRIAYARELLVTDVSVTEVMEKCGFGDFSNFIKTFKKYTGSTPGNYKQSFLKD